MNKDHAITTALQVSQPLKVEQPPGVLCCHQGSFFLIYSSPFLSTDVVHFIGQVTCQLIVELLGTAPEYNATMPEQGFSSFLMQHATSSKKERGRCSASNHQAPQQSLTQCVPGSIFHSSRCERVRPPIDRAAAAGHLN